MLDNFDDNEICMTCGKSLKALAEGIVECKPCEQEVFDELTKLPFYVYFINLILFIFNFDFKAAYKTVLFMIYSICKRVEKWTEK